MYVMIRRLLSATTASLSVVFPAMMGLGLVVLVSCDDGIIDLKELRPGEKFEDCEQCPLMVVVAEGSFMMGSPESELNRRDTEGPRHHVTITSFAVGVYEVTSSEWDRCVDDGGCRHRGNDDDRFGGGPSHPVTYVSWHDAQEYVKWLKKETGEEYRLLSEAEWEYVARAGTNTARYWGESSDGQCQHANGADEDAKRVFPDWVTVRCSDGHLYPTSVGTYSENAFGVHDVLGNVFEWTQDCWHGDYEGAPSDGRSWQRDEGGDCGVAVVRGGSWIRRPEYIRSAYRAWGELDSRYSDVGLRVARSVQIAVDDGPTRPPGGEIPDDGDDEEPGNDPIGK